MSNLEAIYKERGAVLQVEILEWLQVFAAGHWREWVISAWKENPDLDLALDETEHKRLSPLVKE